MHRRRIRLASVVVAAFALGCQSSPTGPDRRPLATGRWTGGGACLSVTDSGCDLVVGCGHGQFARPMLDIDSRFDVNGTYRIEVGPISIEPAPPARFSGSVTGSQLTLTVVPSAASLSSAVHSMTLTGTGTCVVPCL